MILKILEIPLPYENSSSIYVGTSSPYFGFFLGLLQVSFRPLFYNPYAAKIIETYCAGIRANCSGVKIYYNS